MKMAPITTAFALIFIAMGLAGYYRTHAPTSLIPTALGVLLWICAEVAAKPERRKHAMHAAAMLGLLGFAGSVMGLAKLPALFRGDRVARPLAVIMQSMMAVFCVIYVALCVISFIQARKARLAGEKKG
jgi:hypothetical protein